ncbi:MAG: histidine kinase N-terminal 7TM domain-containing protein [Candidatus Margulisbacteria bacterium]|nr:histidine kinase N-terminal 7TM domain-containing protein [Candidatus Margulisiibacteriota bacterium]
MEQVLLHINVILCIAFAINLSLAFLIYFKDIHREPNLAFGTILLLISLWTLSFILFINASSPIEALLWRRFTPVGSALIAGMFLYFSLIFPSEKIKLTPLLKCLIIAPGIAFSLFSIFSRWMIEGIIISNEKPLYLASPIFGKLYVFYSIYLILYFTVALAVLTRKYWDSKAREKGQIFYVLFGMGTSIILGMISSLVFPIMGITSFFALGPPITIIMVIFIAYAMVRHQLMSIEDFMSRGILIIGVIGALVGTLFGIIFGKISFLLPLYTILSNLVLGTYVLFNNPRHPINRSFALITLAIAFWSWSIYMLNLSGQSLFWGRAAFVGPIIIPPTFVWFCWSFPRSTIILSVRRLTFLLFPALIMLLMVPTDLIIQNISILQNRPVPIRGIGYAVFVIYFILYIAIGLRDLIIKYWNVGGLQKIQLRYVLWGCIISSAAAALTNLILPAMGQPNLTVFGPIFTLILIVFFSYAIIKHRLMSIEIIVQRSTVYAVSTLIIMTVYALAVVVSELFFRSLLGQTSLLITALVAMIIAIIYQPLVHLFQSFTDRIFFRSRYDYQKTLRQISQQVASVIQLEELTMLLVSSFVDTMKVSEISFLLADKDKEHFRSVAVSLPRYKKIEIDVASPVVNWLNATKDILVRYEVEDEISRLESLGKEEEEKRKTLEEVRDEMVRLGISVWIPIVSKSEIIGIIALGDKLSGDIFSTEDIGLLGTLSSQAAVALDNARLYDEVVNMKDYSEEILQSMVSGVLTTDFKGRIVTLNQMAEKICGKKFEEVVGKSCGEVWGKRGSIPQVIENSLKDRTYINFESGVASPEKGLVPVSFSTTLLRDHSGRKIGVLLTIQDLSEVKELEGKVRQADKLGALATMAAGMAHEIKNPLSSMKVLSQLLPLKYNDPEFRKKLQEILPREINRIDRIVESLLGFARASALQFEKCNIHDILNENIKYFAGKAKEADVEIKTQFADLPEIEIDRGQMSQVFSNLILNSIQAMPNGGEINIVTSPGKMIDNVLQNIKVQISDTGYGIPEDMRKKLFDPFFTTKHGGTGLGLTISHNIVEGHKGDIKVESQVGKGTGFTITLPVKQGGV